MSIIHFEKVFYSYSPEANLALNDISIHIKQGEFLAVMGENTAGKTTFCKLINGIIPHFHGGCLSGSVKVDNQDTVNCSVPQISQTVGMVLDDPDAQLFTSTVRNEAAFGPENLGLPVLEIEQRVKNALFLVGLDGFEKRTPSTLSGGEKQRLSIAAALAMFGKILVLDEPLRRLDPQGAMDVMAVLKDIQVKNNITIIMAEHNSELMSKFADRVCVLKNGSIAALDTAKNIFSNRSLLEENGIQPPCHKGTQRTQSYLNQFTLKPLGEQSPVIEIKDFSYKYPNGISIENINLSIAENDFLAIMGFNGCGKTTLLKSITGLLRPSSGDIFICGKNTKELPPSDISGKIGFVMQNPDSQLFTSSVFKEIAFALKNKNLPKQEIKKRVEESLKMAGLDNSILDVFPHVLSKPDRAKLVIACVLAMGAKIILFDEVDAGDYHGNLNIMNIIKDLHKNGYTIIIVTHNTSLAADYACRLIKMDRKGIIPV
ncbi:MAG: ATP-binding cassette domain-containing protein [Treponema sp.]|jgi:energy-coupling factor transport system ATP-binding protein|nr:ATP-binding cassette domain-containing protein [Treponema sp.]